MPSEQRCNKCGLIKGAAFFSLDRGNLRGRCKKCEAEIRRQKRKADPKTTDKKRDYDFRRQYGISLSERADMLASQGGRCKICGIEEGLAPRKRLAVDHCHETGKVRGLLCDNCNKGIGCLRDDPAILRMAIEYLNHADRRS